MALSGSHFWEEYPQDFFWESKVRTVWRLMGDVKLENPAMVDIGMSIRPGRGGFVTSAISCSSRFSSSCRILMSWTGGLTEMVLELHELLLSPNFGIFEELGSWRETLFYFQCQTSSRNPHITSSLPSIMSFCAQRYLEFIFSN